MLTPQNTRVVNHFAIKGYGPRSCPLTSSTEKENTDRKQSCERTAPEESLVEIIDTSQGNGDQEAQD